MSGTMLSSCRCAAKTFYLSRCQYYCRREPVWMTRDRQISAGPVNPGGRHWNAVKPYALAFLILTGLLFEIVIHYFLKITVVYTQFYYLIIVFAGFWYGRKAVWVALFLGGFQIAVSWIITGHYLAGIPPPYPAARHRGIHCRFVHRADELLPGPAGTAEPRSCGDQPPDRGRSEEATGIANRKLSLLASITRHDIRNQLMALLAFLELSKMKVTDPEAVSLLGKAESAAQNIQRQIEFTKNYEEIGVRAPQWQNVGDSP